jgi:hypothetical protein
MKTELYDDFIKRFNSSIRITNSHIQVRKTLTLEAFNRRIREEKFARARDTSKTQEGGEGS